METRGEVTDVLSISGAAGAGVPGSWGKTTKFEEIDVVTVLFQTSAKKGVIETTSSSGPYSFVFAWSRHALPE